MKSSKKKLNKKSTSVHTKKKLDLLSEQIHLMNEQIKTLKENIKPILLERNAVLESRDKMLISCDASWTKDKVTTAYIIRCASFKDPYKAWMPSKAETSNEAELDALYNALANISTMHLHSLSDKRIEFIEIRTDSQLCVNWLSGKRKCYIEKIKNKINTIKELINGIETLTGKKIKLVWRKRNSTHDLMEANYIAQTHNSVRIH